MFMQGQFHQTSNYMACTVSMLMWNKHCNVQTLVVFKVSDLPYLSTLDHVASVSSLCTVTLNFTVQKLVVNGYL